MGREFVAMACGLSDPMGGKDIDLPRPDPGLLVEFVQRTPPMRGAENMSVELLGTMWKEMGEALFMSRGRA